MTSVAGHGPAQFPAKTGGLGVLLQSAWVISMAGTSRSTRRSENRSNTLRKNNPSFELGEAICFSLLRLQ
jgi:hypothetical protein